MPTLLELLGSDGCLAFGFFGGLVAEPGAAGHFHAAFFVDSEAFGGDDVAFFDDVFDVFGAAFGLMMDSAIFLRMTGMLSIFRDSPISPLGKISIAR